MATSQTRKNSYTSIKVDKKPDLSKPFELEGCLTAINDKGYYQIRTLIILSILWGVVPVIAVLLPFFTIHPEYLCKLSQEDNSDFRPCEIETLCDPYFNFIIKESDDMYYTWMNNFDLKCENEYLTILIGSVYFTGMILSNIIIPQICKKYGRKPVLNSIILVYILNNCMLIFSSENKILLIYSLIAGFVYTAISIPAFVLNFEYTTKKSKSLFSSIINSSYSIGALIQIAIFYAFKNWKMSLAFNIIVFFIVGLNTHKIKESPTYLLDKNEYSELTKNFEEISILNKTKETLAYYLRNHPLERNKMLDKINEIKTKKSSSMIGIFKSGEERRLILIVGTSWFANSLIQYGTIFNIKKYGSNIFVNAVSLYIASIISILLSSLVIDIYGTRKSLIIYYIFNLVANATISIINYLDIIKIVGNIPLYFLLFLSSFSTSAIGSLNYIFTAELFKDKDIVTAISTGSLINRLAGIISPMLPHIVNYPTIIFTILSSITITLLMKI